MKDLLRSAAIVLLLGLPAVASAQTAPDRPNAPPERPAAPATDADKQAAPKADAGDTGQAPAKPTPPASDSAEKPDVIPPSSASEWPKEGACTDGKDNDNDSLTDCADDDCKAEAKCKAGQGKENTDAKCSDWVDNDGDGNVDCDDRNCMGPGIKACRGSWEGPLQGTGTRSKGPQTASDDVPELGEGQSVEDLIGTGSDKDGERSDQDCSDGIDNDLDGKIDCADFGCRFDPSVTVCRGNPGMRFSVVAGVEQTYNIKNYRDGDGTLDTRFSRIQLRSFGPVPLIDNSFYLLSLRSEKTPRLTFAMFQMPLGKHGHMININSGGGGLSSALIISAAKQLLLEPAYYVYSAFEQGNGASVEISGPIGSSGKLRYRVFAAGGSGRFTGNVGGRYFTYGNTNYTYAVGGQLGINVIGMYSRFDTPFLYTPAPTTLAFLVGGKYDQRAQERYPAMNVFAIFRSGRFVLLGENYSKQELEFDSFQTAYVIQAGFLAIKKRLLLAADFGEYIAGEMKNPPAKLETDLRKQLDERQWRLAAHFYFYRNVGVMSLLYKDRRIQNPNGPEFNREQQLSLEANYRF